ncbi:MAG: LptF/LptG family permease, partial [Bacteroidota bacterium]
MFRLKLIDRYIVKQYLVSFFFILGMVMAIAFVVDLVEKIDDFLEKDPPMIELLRDYYANFFPYYGNLLSPVCIYLAVIFFTSRMA